MTDNNQKIEYVFKFIIVGNAAVGKSNICFRFTKGEFSEKYQATIGLDFSYKNVTIGDKNYRIQVWDTAGQECFRSISRGYYKSSVCALVVYDITNRESFNSISTWIEECKNNGPKTITLVLIGNKSDLENNRNVSYEEGEELANRFNMKFYETSACTGKNIDKLFYETTEGIIKGIEKNIYDLSNDDCGIMPGTGKKRTMIKNNELKKKKCC